MLNKIRTLFSIILSTCFPSTPSDLWNKYKDHIAEDILHQKRLRTSNANLQINEELYNEVLILIEYKCLMLTNKGLIQLGMITPNPLMHDAFNQELRRETQYDSEALKETVLRNVLLLNEQEKYAYNTPMKVLNHITG